MNCQWKCCCNCNCQKTCNNEYLETICNNVGNVGNVSNYNNSEKNCECGFEEEFNPFPSEPILAQSYVPQQIINTTFIPCVGLKMGTIFPELVRPYMPGQSMEEIAYIRATNKIGEGCNKC